MHPYAHTPIHHTPDTADTYIPNTLINSLQLYIHKHKHLNKHPIHLCTHTSVHLIHLNTQTPTHLYTHAPNTYTYTHAYTPTPWTIIRSGKFTKSEETRRRLKKLARDQRDQVAVLDKVWVRVRAMLYWCIGVWLCGCMGQTHPWDILDNEFWIEGWGKARVRV